MGNSRTGPDYLEEQHKKKNKKLWETMNKDIMKNKSKKKRYKDIEEAMKNM